MSAIRLIEKSIIYNLHTDMLSIAKSDPFLWIIDTFLATS